MAISAKITSNSSTKVVGTQNAPKSSDAFNIKASAIPVSLSGTQLSSTKNVNEALKRLDSKTATQATSPTSPVEGDSWYDSDDDKYYIRDEDSWNEIVVSGVSGTVDGGGYS